MIAFKINITVVNKVKKIVVNMFCCGSIVLIAFEYTRYQIFEIVCHEHSVP